MIELFGLEGYTGKRVASEHLIEEQRLVWAALMRAQVELRKRQEPMR